MPHACPVDLSTPRCVHCGLPLRTAAVGEQYCCHACRLAAAIIGRHAERGTRVWHLLRLGFGMLLAMNIMSVSLLMYGGCVDHHSVRLFRLLALSLSAPALLMLLPPFLEGAFRELSRGRPNLNLLIATGSLAAFAVSSVNTLRGAGQIYFDTATMLPVLVTLGTFLEAGARGRAWDLLKSLESLLPATAVRITPTGGEEIPLKHLQRGDLVRVFPGQRIPVDGTIEAGSASIAETAFTGEPLPRQCGPGDRVIAGTINGLAPILVKMETSADQFLLRTIATQVEAAWRHPSGQERLAERLAARFIPLVAVLSVGTLAGWSLIGDPARGGMAAISVLVVACPCTFGLATPLVTSLAILRAARNGLVVRNGLAMEAAADVREIFFDKTGTLTVGAPEIIKVIPAAAIGTEELLGRVAALESGSEHALGRALCEAARQKGIPVGTAEEIAAHPGRGISGIVTWRGRSVRVRAGTPEFAGPDTRDQGDDSRCTVIDVSWEDRHAGRILLEDRLRADARITVARLRDQGIRCVIVSGDRYGATRKTADELGISGVDAPCPPEEKARRIRAAAASESRTAMVGDGINDAPALAAADLGIAINGGMDLARQAGNVVMLSERLELLPWLIGLSRAARSRIRQNLAWSVAYNAVALTAAAAGMLHPILAAAAMIGSSMTILGNSLRIMAYPDDPGYCPASSLPMENAGPSSGPIP